MTFGYTTNGASSTFWSASHIEGSYFTGGAGTVDSMTYWVTTIGAGSWQKVGIYLKSNSSFVAEIGEWQLTAGYDNWKTLTAVSPPTISAVDYWLVVFDRNNGNYANYDTGSSGQGVDDTSTSAVYDGSPGWENPISTATTNTNKYSIYATYTASGGGGNIPFTNPNLKVLQLMGIGT